MLRVWLGRSWVYILIKSFSFCKKHSFGVSLLWSPIRKSRVKALIKPRIFMNICYEIIKNYEQLSSTISKFEAFFSKIWALFERFFAIFWALFSEFSCAIRTCLGPPILSNGKGHFGRIERNVQTGQSGLPSKVVPNIPFGPNRNGPFHLMYQPKFPEFCALEF